MPFSKESLKVTSVRTISTTMLSDLVTFLKRVTLFSFSDVSKTVTTLALRFVLYSKLRHDPASFEAIAYFDFFVLKKFAPFMSTASMLATQFAKLDMFFLRQIGTLTVFGLQFPLD